MEQKDYQSPLARHILGNKALLAALTNLTSEAGGRSRLFDHLREGLTQAVGSEGLSVIQDEARKAVLREEMLHLDLPVTEAAVKKWSAFFADLDKDIAKDKELLRFVDDQLAAKGATAEQKRIVLADVYGAYRFKIYSVLFSTAPEDFQVSPQGKIALNFLNYLNNAAKKDPAEKGLFQHFQDQCVRVLSNSSQIFNNAEATISTQDFIEDFQRKSEYRYLGEKTANQMIKEKLEAIDPQARTNAQTAVIAALSQSLKVQVGFSSRQISLREVFSKILENFKGTLNFLDRKNIENGNPCAKTLPPAEVLPEKEDKTGDKISQQLKLVALKIENLEKIKKGEPNAKIEEKAEKYKEQLGKLQEDCRELPNDQRTSLNKELANLKLKLAHLTEAKPQVTAFLASPHANCAKADSQFMAEATAPRP